MSTKNQWPVVTLSHSKDGTKVLLGVPTATKADRIRYRLLNALDVLTLHRVLCAWAPLNRLEDKIYYPPVLLEFEITDKQAIELFGAEVVWRDKK